MLVLSRRVGEIVCLELPDGKVIEVTVNNIQSNTRVHLAINADKFVNVYRKELKDGSKKRTTGKPDNGK